MSTQTKPLENEPLKAESRRRTWAYIWDLFTYRPWHTLLLLILETQFFTTFPQLVGLLIRNFFNTLSGEAPAQFDIWALLAILVGVNVVRVIFSFWDVYIYFRFEHSIAAVLRTNLFANILKRPGARAVPGSPGEAISRFRGDVREVANFMAEALTPIAWGLFAVIAFIVMANINTTITLVVMLPLVLVFIAANAARGRIEKYRTEHRSATGRVVGFIAELFGNVQAVKVATAETRVLERFAILNETRREAALKDRLFRELLGAIFRNATNLGTGLILLLSGQAIAKGEFTIGDFALFIYYLAFITDFTAAMGEKMAWFKQVGVSFSRMDKLLQEEAPEALTAHSETYISGEIPPIANAPKDAEIPLKSLTLRGVTYHYPDTTNGVTDINLSLKRGTFTVITGRVGSGKTTLLRAMLGLLPLQDGEILWNGEPVKSPETFFVPPHAAYTPQVPLFFSDSLADNILMGIEASPEQVEKSIYKAVMEDDLKEMEMGLDAMIGVKGVKLSGGQLKRSAAARMFVREPELLVFDDISSALDVETEHVLWDRVFTDRETTCLAVSHRRPALERADKIIVLKNGEIEAMGMAAELLKTSAEFRLLWDSQD